MATRVISQTINLTNKPINNYITEITNEGISIHPDSNINDGIEISDHIIIKKNGTPVAYYGESTIIGAEDGFHIKLDANDTEGRLSFYQGPNEVAYINNNQLYISQSVVLEQMDLGTLISNNGFGQWSWKVHPNGQSPSRNNLNLKWVG